MESVAGTPDLLGSGDGWVQCPLPQTANTPGSAGPFFQWHRGGWGSVGGSLTATERNHLWLNGPWSMLYSSHFLEAFLWGVHLCVCVCVCVCVCSSPAFLRQLQRKGFLFPILSVWSSHFWVGQHLLYCKETLFLFLKMVEIGLLALHSRTPKYPCYLSI